MLTAIIGLLGVVAGGLVTFGTQALILRRAEAARTTAAARVLQVEILQMTAALGLSQLEGFEDVTLGSVRLLAEWETYRDDLTRLPTDAWYPLVTLVATLNIGGNFNLDEIGAALSRELGEANAALERVLKPPRRERGLVVAVACALGRLVTYPGSFWMRWRARGIVIANRLVPRDRSGSGRRP